MIIELNQINIRYRDYRCRNDRIEKNLLNSISQIGITEPLSVVKKDGAALSYLLLDGFKRFRCAQKLNLHQIPVTIIGDNEVAGVLRILCHNQSSNMNSLEESVFLENLNSTHGLSYSEIARKINRSVSWVSLRVEMTRSMSALIREKILSGKFPLRSYIYDLIPFTRVKGGMKDVGDFVTALSGKGFSTRDIALMSHAFFRGEEEIKQQILNGNCDWTLRMLKTADESPLKPSEVQTPTQHLTNKLNLCYSHINQIIDQFTNAPGLLSDHLLKGISERLGKSCYCYLNIIQELEV